VSTYENPLLKNAMIKRFYLSLKKIWMSIIIRYWYAKTFHSSKLQGILLMIQVMRPGFYIY